jgi:hypothetical protein
MKGYTIIVVVFMLLLPAFGQGSFTDFQGGFLFPADAKTGLIFGIQTGRMADEAIGYGFELDFYRKKYVEDTEISRGEEGGAEITEVIPNIDNTTIMLPLLFKLNYSVPLAQKLSLRLSGGAGYEVMWNSVTKYSENIDNTKFYHGFVWMVGGGLSLPLSRASDIFLEVNYHSSEPSRGEGETAEGAPIKTKIDMSGMLLRVGIRLFTIGL